MTTHYLHAGRVTLEYDDAAHSYRANGELVPSVTQVTNVLDKPALPAWAAKACADWLIANCPLGVPLEGNQLQALAQEMKGAPQRIKQEAAGVGSVVHDFILRHFTDHPMPLPEEGQARQACLAALDFCEQHAMVPEAAEFKIYHSIHAYAGTADFIGTMDGERVLVDWKSSAGVYPEMHAQTAAYQAAWRDEHGGEALRRAIVRFDKNTGAFNPAKDVVWRTVEQQGHDFSAFLSMLNLHHWLDGQKKRKKQ